jgi:hypothetical protein
MLGVLLANASTPTTAERRARTTPVQNAGVLRAWGLACKSSRAAALTGSAQRATIAAYRASHRLTPRSSSRC